MIKMNRITMFVLIIVFLAIHPLFVLSNSNTNQEIQTNVICTTSALAYLAEEIGQDLITVTRIAPVGMCPAHFDIKPSQIQAVRDAKILISHNFEPWIDNLLISADNTSISRLILDGPWNTPSSAIDKINKISSSLGNTFPDYKSELFNHARELIQTIQQNTAHIKEKASDLEVNKIKVISSFHQEPFLTWLGFNVITTYPSPEMISTRQYLELLLSGKTEQIDLIVDNLQSGTDFGSKLAFDLQCSHAILTNFPGLIPETETLIEMLQYNAEQLFQVLEAQVPEAR